MKNFVVKTAVKTFILVLCLLLVAFAILSFAFPQHMASFSERIGNYDMALKYASLRYSYTDDTEDLARCFEDAILAEDNSAILQYGDEFFAKDDHASVMYNLSLSREMDYYNIFGSSLVKARYTSGKFGDALAFATLMFIDTQTFTNGCPLMALAAQIVGNSDSENAPALLATLEGISVEDSAQALLLANTIVSVRQVAEN